MIESEWIDDSKIRSRIKAAEAGDLATLALQWHSMADPLAPFLLTQAAGRKSAKSKLPLWYAQEKILYPDNEVVEQSSSEDTAAYKATTFKANCIADLCGGMGVDAAAFCKAGARVLFNEPDKRRYDFAKHNLELLGCNRASYFNLTAEAFVSAGHYRNCDLIYIDPSRRNLKKRVIHPGDYQPRLTEIVPVLLDEGKRILIKTSPMLDVQVGLAAFPACSEVHVVGRADECRELLFYCEPGFNGEARIIATECGRTNVRFEMLRSTEQETPLQLSPPLTYLFDPFSVVLKAGAFRSLLNCSPGLYKLHSQTHLYTSANMLDNFPGKAYELVAVLPYKKEEILRFLDGKKAVTLFRNFPEAPEKAMKKLAISSGTDYFLFFCTINDNRPAILVTRRCSTPSA